VVQKLQRFTKEISMYKLIILIEELADTQGFEKDWPEFLKLAEAMPGLQRETTSWSEGMIYGNYQVTMIHELYFNDRDSLQRAMESTAGQAAGRLLQRITNGQMTLLFAHHLEDDLENIRAFREAQQSQGEDADH
jgi:hypothetical protein